MVLAAGPLARLVFDIFTFSSYYLVLLINIINKRVSFVTANYKFKCLNKKMGSIETLQTDLNRKI